MPIKLKLKDYKNYLILQTAFIGDVALSLFFAEALKKINPDAKIKFITTPTSYELVNSAASISSTIIFDKKNTHKKISQIKYFANEINQFSNIDIIFSLHKSLRSALLTKFIKAKYKIGFDKNALSFLLDKRVKYQKSMHEIDRNLQILNIFEEYNSNSTYRFSPKINFSEISNSSILDITTVLNNNKYLVVVAVGSVWQTKKWPQEYFMELIKSFKKNNYEVILIGSKVEQKLCETIAKVTSAISLAGKTTISETLQILNYSKLLITNDSAPTHFASILNIPTITIFGPTSPIFGFYPIATNSVVVEDINLSCRPCSIHGENICPKKTHDCMNNITPTNIFSIAMNLLKKTS